jgi:hypothetical protein
MLACTRSHVYYDIVDSFHRQNDTWYFPPIDTIRPKDLYENVWTLVSKWLLRGTYEWLPFISRDDLLRCVLAMRIPSELFFTP